MNLFYLPQFPERFYHLDSGVTAVDFSAAHPNLLAVSSYLKLLFTHWNTGTTAYASERYVS